MPSIWSSPSARTLITGVDAGPVATGEDEPVGALADGDDASTGADDATGSDAAADDESGTEEVLFGVDDDPALGADAAIGDEASDAGTTADAFACAVTAGSPTPPQADNDAMQPTAIATAMPRQVGAPRRAARGALIGR